jgi:hypothetical protein
MIIGRGREASRPRRNMVVAGKIELDMVYALLARFGSQCYITCAVAQFCCRRLPHKRFPFKISFRCCRDTLVMLVSGVLC